MSARRNVFASLTAIALATTAASAQNLVTNPGFETGTYAGYEQFPTGPGQQTITNVNPSSGLFAARITNDVTASNSLIKAANLGVGIVVPNGQIIDISFDARGSFGIGGVAFAEFFSELSGGGVSKGEILGGAPLNINGNPEIWTTFSFTATTGSNVSGGVTLQLGATNGAAGAGTEIFYDNIVVSPRAIPEPAAISLLGLAALPLVRRRRA